MAKKGLKKGLKIAGFSLLGILIVLIVLPMFFQKQLVNIALKQADKMLNAKIEIGDFRLTVLRNFPNPTLKIEDVVVLNKGVFEGDTLAKIGNFDVCFDLMSLFSPTYHLKKLNISDALINLKVNEDTIANWDIVIPDSLQEEDTTAEPIEFNLKVDKLTLNHIDAHYADIPAGMYGDVEDLNFDFKGDLSDELTTVFMELSTKSVDFQMNKIPYLKKAVLGLKTEADADLKNMKFTLKDNQININSLALQLEGWVALPEDGIDMDMQLKLKQNEFKNILSLVPAIYAKNFSDIRTKGTLALSAFAKGKLADDLYPAFGLELLIGNAMFQYPSLPAAVTNINIDAKVSNKGGSLDNTVIDIPKFHFDILSNPFDIFALIKTPISDPNLDVALKGTLNLADIKKVYPLENSTDLNGIFKMDVTLKGLLSYIEKEQYTQFDAKGTLDIANLLLKNTDIFDQDVSIAEAKLVFSSAFADLQKLSLKFGRNDLSIKGKVENYLPYLIKDEGVLKGNLAVSSNYLNINDFASQPIASATQTETASQEAEEPLSLIQVPDNLNITANLNIVKLIYDNLEMDNAALACAIADKKLTIKNLAAGLFKGDIKVNGYYQTPQINRGNADIHVIINKISPKDLCKTFGLFDKFMPILKNADGRVSLTLNGNTDLKETMQMDYNTVNLNGILSLTDLSIKGADGLMEVANALKIEQFKNLTLRDVKVSYAVKDGKMTTIPFDFKIDKTEVSVEKGTVGLDKSLSYSALLNIPKSIMGTQALAMLGQLNSKAKALGLPVNESDVVKLAVKIGGTIDKPKIDVGLDKMKDQLQETVKEKVEEVKEQVKETVNKALQEAQRQADALVAEAQKQADALLKSEKVAADKILSDARAEADKMVASTTNPLEKAAKKAAADKLLEEAQKKADKTNAEAQKKANQMVADAKAKGDKLIEDAKR